MTLGRSVSVSLPDGYWTMNGLFLQGEQTSRKVCSHGQPFARIDRP